MRELVLTGRKDCWPSVDDNAVYMGPWCFDGNLTRGVMEQNCFTLAPNPWSDKRSLCEATNYIDGLIDRIISPLAEAMNDYYGTKYSVKFWKVCSIIWLSSWLGIFYDRYIRLKYAVQTFDEEFIVNIPRPTVNLRLQDFNSLQRVVHGDDYNLYLWSLLIHEGLFSKFSIKYVDLKIESEAFIRKSITAYLQRGVQSVFNVIPGDVRWGNVYGLSIKDKLLLYLKAMRLKDLKIVNDEKVIPKCSVKEFEGHELKFSPLNEYEGVVKKHILRNLPAYIVDGIPALKRRVKRKYWIGIDVYKSGEASFEVAKHVEHGGGWVASQHGGGYGELRSYPQGKIEYETSGYFISWGWSSPHCYKGDIIPMPSPMLWKCGRHRASNGDVLFIGGFRPKYLSKLSSGRAPEDGTDYLNDKKRFFSMLPSDIRSKVLYRSHFDHFGTHEVEYMRDQCGLTRFLTAKKLVPTIERSRIIVIDHMSTSMLQSMAMSTPIILFWRPQFYCLTDEAQRDIDMLKAAGIYYENPQEAADKLSSIYDNVVEWWLSKDVQHARAEYAKKYACCSKDYLKRWGNIPECLSTH